jgi:hypothetical protein
MAQSSSEHGTWARLREQRMTEAGAAEAYEQAAAEHDRDAAGATGHRAGGPQEAEADPGQGDTSGRP